MNYSLGWFLAFFLISGCTSKSLTQPSVYTEGCVISKLSKYSVDKLPAFSTSAKIWYKGNELIQEIQRVHFNTDTHNIQTISYILDHYVYVNYDTRQFSFYHSFSDTAQAFKKYLTLDSLNKEMVTDFFKNSQKALDFVTQVTPINDTSISGISYQRKKYIKRWKGKIFLSIVYFRCDRPNSRFSIFKNIADSCSPVKVFDYNGDGTILNGSVETIFLADSLTMEERKIFETWRKQLPPK